MPLFFLVSILLNQKSQDGETTIYKKQQDILALLQKGCNLKKIAKTLHVCKSSV